jgi:hypothetical protein
MYNLKPITLSEKDRLIEIEFYLFISYLLDKYNKSAVLYDIIDTFAELFGCNKTILHNIMLGIYNRTSIIIPDKEELAVILYKSGMSTRNIRNITKIHQQTLYRILNLYKLNGQLEFGSRLDEEIFLQVKEFMIQFKQITRWKQ